MGRVIRIGLVLTAAACLMAVVVDWVLEELNGETAQAGLEAPKALAAEPQAVEAEQVSVEAVSVEAVPVEPVSVEAGPVEAGPEDAGPAEDVIAESYDQG
jgi:hypothetical protein